MESLVGRSQDVMVMEERRRSRRKMILICLGCILVVAVLLALLIHFYVNRTYNGYKTKKTITVKNSDAMKYCAYKDGVLRYSRDGAAAVDDGGKEMWNGSYDMENPAVDVCDAYAVVADIQGKDLYVYNGEDSGTQMTMDYPILQACVSSQGVVAVILEDTASDMIRVYNPYDSNTKLLVEIPTNVEDGFPVSMDLSPDGTGVVASFVCVTSGVVKSRAAFYDFTDVGKNTNCLVGAQEYQDRVVSEVRYLDKDHACLFSEKGFSLWQNMKKPKEVSKQQWDTEILSAFCNEDYVGVVLKKNKEDKAELRLYSERGKQMLKREISSDFSHISMEGDEIYITASDSCQIYRKNGVRKWNCKVKDKVTALLPAKGLNCYFLLQNGKIQLIKLKNKG